MNGVEKQNQKTTTTTKKQAKQNEGIKQDVLNLLEENDDVEEQGLTETANNVNNSQEAIVIIPCYEEIIREKPKKAIVDIGKQGELFKKFTGNVGQSKSMIHSKISLYKFLKKYPLLETSTLQSSYFKNNFKTIKVVWKENSTFFFIA